MKTLLVALTIILLFSCTPAPQVKQIQQAPVPMTPTDFWALYNEPQQSGYKGYMNIQQQAEMATYFCHRTAMVNPDSFNYLYDSINECMQREGEGFSKIETVVENLTKAQDYKKTIGFYCMTEATEKYCSSRNGFCYWDAFNRYFVDCVKAQANHE
ncbi:MAG: hypothetical protein WBN24_12600 [Acidimicrobiia bacterium]